MDNKTKFCRTCNDDVIVEIESTTLKGEIKGDSYLYEGIEPCTACGHFIPDEEIDKHNLKLLNDTYRLQNDIISLEQIQELPKKYDIGKRPLSNLLDWGELTFTRYFNSDIPSRAYSDVLKQIYNSPEKYLGILEENKENISNKTYEKSKLAAQNLLQNNSKIFEVINYILTKCDDISPLAVQKLLYYCHGFYFAFFEKSLFEDKCIATEKGPYYLDFSSSLSTEYDLTKTETLLIDSVIKYFGCYSSMVLTRFTTNELPYLNTEIKQIYCKDSMFDFFILIKNKYQMLHLDDIRNYTCDIFRKEI